MGGSVDIGVDRRALVSGLGAIGFAAPAWAQTGQEVDPQLAAYMARQPDFMGAVLVARGPERLLSRGYGLCNVELGVANTPSTPFKIGSISKLFTTEAILMLADAGKLSLDDPLSKYLPDCPASWSAVRVKHLLDHASGIPDIVRVGDFSERMLHPASFATIIEALKPLPLDFAPGTSARYGNSGPIVAAYLVERLSGLPYERFLDERIYRPLGLTHSGWADNARLIAGRASGYLRVGGSLQNAPYIDMSLPIGAGAQYASVEDLHVWWLSIEGRRLLSPASTERMFAPGPDGYGLGWRVETVEGRRKVSHVGDINGFGSFLAAWPDSGVFVVALSNVERTPVKTLCDDLAGMMLAKT